MKFFDKVGRCHEPPSRRNDYYIFKIIAEKKILTKCIKENQTKKKE
jgi:hypothetical protein